MSREAEGPQYDELASALGVLANPSRLRLMHKLLSPQPLGEIQLPAIREYQGGRAGRIMSRQGVRQHLRSLVGLGLVHVKPGASHHGARQATYQLNPQRLFALIEEIRKLGQTQSAATVDVMATTVLETRGGVAGETSPCAAPHLLVVHGSTEGRRFPLGPERPGRWELGRRPGLPVAIDWDPYVSSSHLVLQAGEAGGYVVENLSSNLNGTTRNFEPLAPGAMEPIEHGDVLGVGKTLLVFRER